MKVRQYRGKWIADYTDQFGKRHRPSFETKREANDHLIEAKSAIRMGSFRPEAQKTLVATVAAEFISDCEARRRAGELTAATATNYIGHTRRYILGELDLWSPQAPDRRNVFFTRPLGRLRLADVDASVVNEFRRDLLNTGLAPGTVRLVLVALTRIFKLAQLKKLVVQNPVEELKRTSTRASSTDKEVSIPEKETVRLLIECAPPEGRLHIMFAAATGVRAGEQRGLRWRDIDFERRRFHVRQTVDRFKEVKGPKTSAGTRTVPLSPPLVHALQELKANTEYGGLDDLVFPSASGEPVHHSTWINGFYAKAWRKLLARPEARGVKKCNWHALRHFAISTWIASGVPLKRVQRWAGHSSAQVTLNTYTHLFESEDHADLMDQVGNEIFGEN